LVQITENNYRERILSYYDKVAPDYGVKHGADLAGGQYGFGELYKKVLAPYFSKGAKVLELGCGNGASSEMLASYGVELTATDISDEMLIIARSRDIPNTKFLRLDAMALGEAQQLGQFDVITAFNSFAYYPAKAKVLRELRSHLNENGRLVILDMNALCPVYPLSAWIGRLEMSSWWSTTKEMTPSGLRRLFAEAGYRVERLETLNFVPHAVGGAVFQLLKFVNPLLNATPLVNKLAMRVLIVVEPLPDS
jgi:2-polyprenyl-3-methyl-5-hydroxy-6-metoxy-1,4-benzoquinol methylase